MTGQKEKEEKGEKEEEKKLLRACGRTDGPTKGSTRGPKNLLHGMETELLYDLFTWLGDVEYGFFRVFFSGCCKNRRKEADSYSIDENNVYGTYNRGSIEDGEYGDNDVMEVKDNNDYYEC